MTPDEIKAKNARTAKQVYVIEWIFTIFLMVATLTLAVLFIVNVFKGHVFPAIGFAILTYAVFWVFRRVPWPETEEDRRKRELRQELMRRLSR